MRTSRERGVDRLVGLRAAEQRGCQSEGREFGDRHSFDDLLEHSHKRLDDARGDHQRNGAKAHLQEKRGVRFKPGENVPSHVISCWQPFQVRLGACAGFWVESRFFEQCEEVIEDKAVPFEALQKGLEGEKSRDGLA